MKRVAFHTLGCKLNYAETSSFGGQFVRHGYELVTIDQPADVVVINTCSVTDRADHECRQIVRRALRRSPQAFVAVVGCYAQLQPEEIAAIRGVDLVLGTKEKFKILDYLGNGEKRRKTEIDVSCIDDAEEAAIASSFDSDERTRAFLKIQDGCDYTCSFCTIPLARGASRSIAIPEVLVHAQRIADAGFKEIVLTGVNVGDYGRKTGDHIIDLLKAITAVQGIHRVRISSIEPNLLTDELLDFWFSEKKLCKHWHIPLQSGSNAILSGMRRRYRREVYQEKVEKIKSAFPDAGIGADVIVGFPSETEELFQETYQFLRDLPVTYLHVFSYSERPHTAAITMHGKVAKAVQAERSERLRQLGLRKKILFYESFMNKTLPVLFETRKNGDIFSGLTEEYVRVDVRTGEDIRNKILPVVVRTVDDSQCTGTLLNQ